MNWIEWVVMALVGGVLLLGVITLLCLLVYFGVRLGRFAWLRANGAYEAFRRREQEQNGSES